MSSNSYGEPLTVTYGFDRVEPKAIWVSNFKSHSGGSGLFGSGAQTTYTANPDLFVCMNPAEGVADVWYNGAWFYIYTSTFTVPVSSVTAGQTVSWSIPAPSSPFGPVIMVAGVFLAGIPFSESYSDYVYPGEVNAFTLSGPGLVPLYNNAFPAPNFGQWSDLGQPTASYNQPYGSSSGSVTFPSAISTPFTIVVIYFFGTNALSGNTYLPLRSALLTWESSLGSGSSGQPIVYTEMAGVSGENINLGGSAFLPQWGLHTKGMWGIGYPVATGSWNAGTQMGQTTICCGDCNPADVCFDLVTSGNIYPALGAGCWNHGLGFSGFVLDPTGGIDNIFTYSRYGSLAIDESGPIGFLKMRNYCLAYSILVSHSLTSQESGAEILKELAEITNCAPCFDGASLDFIPYCEVSSFANGANFIAPTANGPVQAFDRSMFKTTAKDKSGNSNPKAPLVTKGGAPEENFNSLAINFKDRTGTTNNNTVILTDTVDVSRQGPLTQGSRSWPWIQNPPMAVNAGWAVLRRNVLVERDGKYLFGLNAPWASFLSLMDLVTVDEPTLSPDPIPVRITKITEDEADFSAEFEAEKFVYGASLPLPPATSITGVISGGGSGSGGGGFSDPGNVNTPIFIEAIPAIADSPELWICVSGGANILNGIIGATQVSGGAGYKAATVTVTGSGTGAVLDAVIYQGPTIFQPTPREVVLNGSITSLVVQNPGSGYTGSVTITITDPTGLGTGASFTAIVGTVPVSYGGCQVNLSTNLGVSYAPVNDVNTNSPNIVGSQTMGVVYSSDYPPNADPDNTDTLNVDLTESQQELAPFTTAQQNSFLSLCYLEGGGTVPGPFNQVLTIPYELVAYASETLSAPDKYALAPPILRGVHTTPIADHPIGSQFSFLNDGLVFKMALPANLIGVTLYFKFLAFSQLGSVTQSLAAATAYTFTPTGQVGFSSTEYVISPTPTVFQGQPGGWAGIDPNSSTWTNTADVYFPVVTVTFHDGTKVSYAARDSGVNVPITAANQVVYVTIYDPGLAGEPGGTPTLACYADLNQIRWNTPGYVRIGTLVSNSPSAGGGSGSGGGSGGSATGVSYTYLGVPSTTRGPFQYPHGLGVAPNNVTIEGTAPGEINFQNAPNPPWDSTYIYLNASADGLTALLVIET
jgi:hypothetical protein